MEGSRLSESDMEGGQVSDMEGVVDPGSGPIDVSGGPVRHLVFSGGIIYGFAFYGALKRLSEVGVVDVRRIETMYATSVGSILSAIVALNYEWEVLDNYFIKRPWQEVFNFSLNTFIQCYQKRGLFGIEIVRGILEPLFRAKDLDIDTLTLAEFHTATGMEHHFFAIRVHDFELMDLSYRTHPEWRVLDAVYASACLPPFFQPLYIPRGEGVEEPRYEWYTDGGFLANYPVDYCLQRCMGVGAEACAEPFSVGVEGEPYSILGFNLYDRDYMRKLSNDGLNLLEYIYVILSILVYKITGLLRDGRATMGDGPARPPVHELRIYPNFKPASDIVSMVNSAEERAQMIAYGVTCADRFLMGPGP